MTSIVNGFVGIKVVLEADHGRALPDALTLTSALLPSDVVLLDLSMSELNGVETTKLSQKSYPHLKIIILPVCSEDRFVMHLMELGVNAYLFKNAEQDEVERAIRTVVEKEFYFNEAFLPALKNRITTPQTASAAHR